MRHDVIDFITSQRDNLPAEETGKQGPAEVTCLCWEKKHCFQPAGAGPPVSGITLPCHTRPDLWGLRGPQPERVPAIELSGK